MITLGFSGISNGEYYKRQYGLRFVGHDSSVALVMDGKLVFAVEEERISRQKHTSSLPLNGIRAALDFADIQLSDVDRVAYTWHATPRRMLHMLRYHPSRIPLRYWPDMAVAGYRVLRDLMWPGQVVRRLERSLGQKLPPWTGVAHHMGHSACAYFTSPFDEAAVLTVDGQGEDESATLGEWQGTNYLHFQSVHSPDSIGILYGAITDFLGMRAAWDEYKVMGMAALGDPTRFAPAMNRLVTLLPGGRYRTWRTAMVFQPGYMDAMLSRVLGIPVRDRSEPLEQVHFDVAAALQARTEQVLFHLLKRLRKLSKSRNLCLAGGVFLNSVANGKILRSGLFDKVFIPPAPGDHGGAVGAALLAYQKGTGASRQDINFTPFLGPGYSEEEMEAALHEGGASRGEVRSGLDYRRMENVARETALLLSQRKIVGWFQGRVEYGPRALGHRSILASPLSAEMKDVVNAQIKHREPFRPFAGAVPLELAGQFFRVEGASPYMQFVLPVVESAQAKIPAVVHSGTCRAQTVSAESDPLFHRLLHEFGELTGVPVVLNTSFNDADEPIVCSPANAIKTFLATDLDALVLGPFLVRKRGTRET
jgi:carbamoyltransferase